MPSRCFVVYCKSGYDSCKEKVSFFEPPKDDESFSRWTKAIPKRNLNLRKSSKICAKHFRPTDIIWSRTIGEGATLVQIPLKKPELVPGAVPSIFPGCPPSCIPKISKTRTNRKTRKSTDEMKVDQQLATVPISEIQPRTSQYHGDGNNPFEIEENLEPTTVPIFEIQHSTSQCDDGDENNPLETEDLRSTTENPAEPYNVWKELDSESILKSFINVSVVKVDAVKSLVVFTMSHARSPQSPSFISIKEVRAMKGSNEVERFILNERFGDPQAIWSSEELLMLTTQFFSSKFCFGLPHSEIEFNMVKEMRTGQKNILNRWQSKRCTKIIEMTNQDVCPYCLQLKQALIVKQARIRKGISNDVCKMKRRLNSITKAKNRLKNANTKLKEQIRNYQEELKKITDERIEEYIQQFNIPAAQTMVFKEIIKIAKYGSKNARRYSTDWLLTCLLMSIRSSGMYNFILQNEILPLPSQRTLRRLISSIKVECGFDPVFFEALKKKMQSKTKQQKYGVLVFDEVSVRKSLKTDVTSMRYQGVVNFGDTEVKDTNEATENNTNEDDLADHALVFGFSSCGENYFKPIGCFAARGPTHGITLSKLTIQAIILLEKAGVKVSAIICDGAKTNRKMWKEFGVSGKLGQRKHFFTNPFDETRNVFVLSDVPHLFKCIRNRLINHDLMTKFGWVRWRHYQVLHEEDKKLPGNLRLCPKLTNAHMYPCSFAKMRVSLMTQVFSRSVAIGLRTYRQRLTEELEDSQPTELFSQYMNDLFDALNRRYPGEGIKPGSPDINKIREGISFLDSWESEVLSGKISKDDFLTPETAEGLRVTLHSVLDLIEFLFSAGYEYILTAKINQDKLEECYPTTVSPLIKASAASTW